MRASQRPYLEKQGGGEANADRSTAAQSRPYRNGGPESVDASGRLLRAEGQEQVKEGRRGTLVYLTVGIRLVRGNESDKWLHGANEVWIESSDIVVVEFLLTRSGEGSPGQIVNVPCVVQINVREDKANGALGLGQKADKKVGPK